MKTLLYILSVGLIFGCTPLLQAQQFPIDLDPQYGEDHGHGKKGKGHGHGHPNDNGNGNAYGHLIGRGHNHGESPGPFEVDDVAIIFQLGKNNTAWIDQVKFLGANEAIAVQYGDHNRATMQQNGGGNTSHLVQKGDYNQYDLDLQGSDIRTRVYQHGNHNRIQQDLEGSNLDYQLIQRGDHNEIIQEEHSSHTRLPGYQLEQNGNGMQIEIRQGNIYH